MSLLLSTKPTRLVRNKPKRNVKLSRHPNPNDRTSIYLIPFVYVDSINSFGSEIYPWSFDRNDKRKIKRLKKKRFGHKKSQF